MASSSSSSAEKKKEGSPTPLDPAVVLSPLDEEKEKEESIITVDPTVLDNPDDDAYESAGYETSSASLTSSVNEYVFENGRRYHAYFGVDKNLMPTDEEEQNRLDIHHEIQIMLFDGGLYRAPLQNPQRILDVGTGTGIWAIDVADRHPEAEVIGTDLSPIQPTWVPPNCRFQVDDAEQEWTFPADHFDFIHCRNLAQGISDWPKLMKEIYRTTAPGGWVQLGENGLGVRSDDGTVADDNPIKVYFDTLCEAVKLTGRRVPDSPLLKGYLEDAGFVDVKVEEYKDPFGPWPKDKKLKRIGLMTLMALETGFWAYGMMAFTRVLGMDSEAADKLCRDGFATAKNKNVHSYNTLYVAYGRKPGSGEE